MLYSILKNSLLLSSTLVCLSSAVNYPVYYRDDVPGTAPQMQVPHNYVTRYDPQLPDYRNDLHGIATQLEVPHNLEARYGPQLPFYRGDVQATAPQIQVPYNYETRYAPQLPYYRGDVQGTSPQMQVPYNYGSGQGVQLPYYRNDVQGTAPQIQVPVSYETRHGPQLPYVKDVPESPIVYARNTDRDREREFMYAKGSNQQSGSVERPCANCHSQEKDENLANAFDIVRHNVFAETNKETPCKNSDCSNTNGGNYAYDATYDQIHREHDQHSGHNSVESSIRCTQPNCHNTGDAYDVSDANGAYDASGAYDSNAADLTYRQRKENSEESSTGFAPSNCHNANNAYGDGVVNDLCGSTTVNKITQRENTYPRQRDRNGHRKRNYNELSKCPNNKINSALPKATLKEEPWRKEAPCANRNGISKPDEEDLPCKRPYHNQQEPVLSIQSDDDFDVQKDAILLHDLLQNCIRSNIALVVDILTHRSNNQRLKIAEYLNSEFNIDFVAEFRKMPGNEKYLLTALIRDLPQFNVQEFYKNWVPRLHNNSNVLLQILTNILAAEFKTVEETYRQLKINIEYEIIVQLQKLLKDNVSADFMDNFLNENVVNGARVEHHRVADIDYSIDFAYLAQVIYTALRSAERPDIKSITATLARRSSDHILEIAKSYRVLYGQCLVDALGESLEGYARDVFIALVSPYPNFNKIWLPFTNMPGDIFSILSKSSNIEINMLEKSYNRLIHIIEFTLQSIMEYNFLEDDSLSAISAFLEETHTVTQSINCNRKPNALAKKIHKAKKNLQKLKESMVKLFTSCSRSQRLAVAESYNELYDTQLAVDLNSVFRDATLRVVIKALLAPFPKFNSRDSYKYLAPLIEKPELMFNALNNIPCNLRNTFYHTYEQLLLPMEQQLLIILEYHLWECNRLNRIYSFIEKVRGVTQFNQYGNDNIGLTECYTDSAKDAKKLHSAMDYEAIIKVLSTRTLEQRTEIAKTYKYMNKMDLASVLNSRIENQDLHDTIIVWLTPVVPVDINVFYKKWLHSASSANNAIPFIMNTLSNSYLKDFNEHLKRNAEEILLPVLLKQTNILFYTFSADKECDITEETTEYPVTEIPKSTTAEPTIDIKSFKIFMQLMKEIYMKISIEETVTTTVIPEPSTTAPPAEESIEETPTVIPEPSPTAPPAEESIEETPTVIPEPSPTAPPAEESIEETPTVIPEPSPTAPPAEESIEETPMVIPEPSPTAPPAEESIEETPTVIPEPSPTAPPAEESIEETPTVIPEPSPKAPPAEESIEETPTVIHEPSPTAPPAEESIEETPMVIPEPSPTAPPAEESIEETPTVIPEPSPTAPPAEESIEETPTVIPEPSPTAPPAEESIEETPTVIPEPSPTAPPAEESIEETPTVIPEPSPTAPLAEESIEEIPTVIPEPSPKAPPAEESIEETPTVIPEPSPTAPPAEESIEETPTVIPEPSPTAPPAEESIEETPMVIPEPSPTAPPAEESIEETPTVIPEPSPTAPPAEESIEETPTVIPEPSPKAPPAEESIEETPTVIPEPSPTAPPAEESIEETPMVIPEPSPTAPPAEESIEETVTTAVIPEIETGKFDATVPVELLHQQISKTDEGGVLKICLEHPEIELRLIGEEYERKFNQKLSNAMVFSNNKTNLLLTNVCNPVSESYAETIKSCHSQKAIIDILVTWSTDVRKDTIESFKELYPHVDIIDMLVDCLKVDKRIIQGLVEENQVKDEGVDLSKVESTVEFLKQIESNGCKMDTDLIVNLTKCSYKTLQVAVDQFEEIIKGVSFETTFSGPKCDGVDKDISLAILRASKSTGYYFAQRLSECISKNELATSDYCTAIIIDKSHFGLTEISEALEDFFETKLEKALKDALNSESEIKQGEGSADNYWLLLFQIIESEKKYAINTIIENKKTLMIQKEINWYPTIAAMPNFNVTEAVAEIKNYVQESCELQKVLYFLTSYNNVQRMEIAEIYKAHEGKDIIEKLRVCYGNNFDLFEVIEALLTPYLKFYAKQIQLSKNAIIDFIATFNKSEIASVSKAYKKMYKISLTEHAQIQFPNAPKAFLRSLTEGQREIETADEEQIQIDVKFLKSLNGSPLTRNQKSTLGIFFATRSYYTIAKILQKVNASDIKRKLENILEADFYELVSNIIDVATTSINSYYTYKLIACYKNGKIVHKNDLLRIFISRSEMNLYDIVNGDMLPIVEKFNEDKDYLRALAMIYSKNSQDDIFNSEEKKYLDFETVQYETIPSILPAIGFNYSTDVKTLIGALTKLSEVDILNIIKILTRRSQKQRVTIFTSLGDQRGLKMLKTFNLNFYNIVRTMMMPLPEFYAQEIEKGSSTIIIDFLVTSTTDFIQQTALTYQVKYPGQKLFNQVQNYLKDVPLAMVSRLLAGRSSEEIEEDQAIADAKLMFDILEAGTLRGDREEHFIEMFATYSYASLRKVIAKCQVTYHLILEERLRHLQIANEYRTLITAIISAAKSTPNYFAIRLDECMSDGRIINVKDFTRIIVSRSEVDLNLISNAFRQKYEFELFTTMKLEKQERYSLLLLAAILEPWKKLNAEETESELITVTDHDYDATIVRYNNFDAINEAITINYSVTKKDVNDVIEMWVKRTNDQRVEIAKAYKIQYNKDLINEFTYFTGKSKDVMISLTTPFSEYYAQEIQSSTKARTDMLATWNNYELHSFVSEYAELKNSPLLSLLQSNLSENAKRFVANLLKGNRDENKVANDVKAADDANFVNRLNTISAEHVEKLIQIFASNSYATIKRISEILSLNYSLDIEEYLRPILDQDFYNLMSAIIRAAKSTPIYYADQLNTCLKDGQIIDNNKFIRILVARSEIDLERILRELEKIYSISKEAIGKATPDEDYAHIILKIMDPYVHYQITTHTDTVVKHELKEIGESKETIQEISHKNCGQNQDCETTLEKETNANKNIHGIIHTNNK